MGSDSRVTFKKDIPLIKKVARFIEQNGYSVKVYPISVWIFSPSYRTEYGKLDLFSTSTWELRSYGDKLRDLAEKIAKEFDVCIDIIQVKEEPVTRVGK